MKTITPPATAAAGDIRPALAALAKVVKKSVPPGAAQQHVRVDPVGRKSFRLTGNGDGTFFTIEMPGEAPAKFGPFLVPLERLKDLVRGAKSGENVGLIPDRSSPPAAEFPAAPKFRAAPVELGEDVTTAILRAFACASTDETRQILQSAYLDVGAGGCRIVGTDGRHLFASRPLEILGLKEPVILPSLKVLGCPLVKGAPSWDLRIAASANGSGGRPFRLTGDNWDLTGHLAEGNYPNYQQVIPPDREFKTRITLPGEILGAMVRALGQMPGRRMQNRPVGLRIGNGSVSLLARQDERSPYQELLITSKVEGKPATVFLNRDYLAKALSFGMNQISVKDEISAVRFTGEGGTMIVMPVRQQGEIEVCRSETLGGRTSPRPSRPKPPRPKPPPAMAKRKPQPKGEPVTPPRPTPNPNGSGDHDPLEAAGTKIADAKEALRSAMAALNAIATELKATRQRQRQSEKEFRSVRSTLRSLRKVEL